MFFVSNKKYKKLLDKNKWLNKTIDEKTKIIDKLNDISSKLSEQNNQKNKTIESLTKQVEKLQWENDILYQYYDLNKDPSQEIRTAVRIDKRVHDLELENIELRQRIQNAVDIVSTVLNNNLYQYSLYNQNSLYNSLIANCNRSLYLA